MMKFFRTHMKKLLMVFMVALLIVWLGGTALDNMLRADTSRADELRGTIFGRDVQTRSCPGRPSGPMSRRTSRCVRATATAVAAPPSKRLNRLGAEGYVRIVS